jgi:hypothetical protein
MSVYGDEDEGLAGIAQDIASTAAPLAIELALDDAFLGIASCGKQHVTISRCKIFLRAQHRPGGRSKAAVKCPRHCLDRLERGRSRQVQRSNDKNDPE